MPKTLYEILNVLPTSSEEEIRKAYRKLALKLHPDHANFPEHARKDDSEFKELNRAYQTLRDPEKRAKYDEKFKIHVSPSAERVGSDLQVTLNVKIKDLIKGIKKTLTLRRKGHCPSCSGTGSVERKYTKCSFCDGTGLQGFELVLGHKRHCKVCDGIGMIPKGDHCPKCKGTGLVPEIVHHEVQLTPLTELIRVSGLGNCCGIRGKAGDLLIDIMIEPDPTYKIKGLDVSTTLQITPAQAILGDETILKIFDKNVPFRIPAGIQHGATIEKIGAGITFGDKTGKLTIFMKIKIPTVITENENELYNKILAIEKETEPWPKLLNF